MNIRRIVKRGDSICFAIPAKIARHLQIARGDYCGIWLNEHDQIVVEPITSYTAAKLVLNKPIPEIQIKND